MRKVTWTDLDERDRAAMEAAKTPKERRKAYTRMHCRNYKRRIAEGKPKLDERYPNRVCLYLSLPVLTRVQALTRRGKWTADLVLELLEIGLGVVESGKSEERNKATKGTR